MTVSNKQEIYNAYNNRKNNNKSIDDITKEFRIAKSTLYKIKKEFDKTPVESQREIDTIEEINMKIDKLMLHLKIE